MKTFATVAAFCLARLVAGAAIEAAPENDPLTNWGPMEFVGPAFVGGANVTLKGDAKSIYEQLLVLNPEYNPQEFPEYRAKTAELEKRELSKRNIICDVAGTAVPYANANCAEGDRYLRRLNGYCRAPAGPRACARVSCSNQCGMFLCNDNSYPIDVWCGNIAGDYKDISSRCWESGNDWGWYDTLKGQVFRSIWNTIVVHQYC
ncbi:hypothetical protein B0I35DRAFT_407683 [Stachybotrys elegans]|uniref:Uncharacterized protein n=1 Tax=Stachybotrys elegans TaxID=80388 RepID=A0A8K0SS60_9HYPO|nr:hypothetical protein B0I35DRAFT_407683 [Stachybotrys elegans]